MAKGRKKVAKIVPATKKNGNISIYEQQQKSVENMIMTSIKQDVPIETMERVLAMRTQLKKEYAKEQFDIAMANFQRECPVIKKSKAGGKTKSGQVAYYYAPIDAIVSQVKEILSKNGLSYTIKTKIKENKVKSICIIKHVAGHQEESEMEVPLGTKTGVMSDSQVTAAAATFSKRYAFTNALGIMTGDEDNEAVLNNQEATTQDATEDEKNKARASLDQCMTLPALKKTWGSFSKQIKADRDVIKHANTIKSFIEDNNNENIK